MTKTKIKAGRPKGSVTQLAPGQHRGFTRGNNLAATRLTMVDYQKFRAELKKVIGGKTNSKIIYYINGKTIIKEDVAKKIEHIFAKRGIKATELWDDWSTINKRN